MHQDSSHQIGTQYIGKLIREVRKKSGLTQVQMAKEMGVSQQVLSRLEKGTTQNPTIRTLQRIADVTNSTLMINYA